MSETKPRPDYVKIALLEYELGIVPRDEAVGNLWKLGCSVWPDAVYGPTWYEDWDRRQRYGKKSILSRCGYGGA